MQETNELLDSLLVVSFSPSHLKAKVQYPILTFLHKHKHTDADPVQFVQNVMLWNAGSF